MFISTIYSNNFQIVNQIYHQKKIKSIFFGLRNLCNHTHTHLHTDTLYFCDHDNGDCDKQTNKQN